ncbi:hypothetical protein B0J14DRAFT_697715 [Halenospora varia]|nr:hypothetical protein B0J14DRAFT_697715 [Halenospora varia]
MVNQDDADFGVSTLQLDDPPTIQPSPFLRLPLEIRKNIYAYIVPNAYIHDWAPEYKSFERPKLREDGGACCPAMLQVNRQTYTELVEEWFRYATYVVTVGVATDKLGFLDMRFDPNDTLPRQLIYIRHLKLNVWFLSKIGSLKHPNQVDNMANLVSLLCQPDASLRTVALRVMLRFGIIGKASYQPDKINELFEFNLSPLHQVRGLAKANPTLKLDRFVVRGMGLSSEILREITGEAHTFLDLLCKEMM